MHVHSWTDVHQMAGSADKPQHSMGAVLSHEDTSAGRLSQKAPVVTFWKSRKLMVDAHLGCRYVGIAQEKQPDCRYTA